MRRLVSVVALLAACSPAPSRSPVPTVPAPAASPSPTTQPGRAAMQTYDEISAESPAFKKLYESWKQFAADEHLWFRIGENSFENFVYPKSQKT